MLPVKKASLISTGQPISPQNRVHIFIILLAAGCLTTMTGGVVSPVFPEMVQELRFDPKWAGMLLSAHALASALSTPVMGIVADRLGKLRVLVPALVMYALFGMSGAFITHFSLLLCLRVLLGIASGGIAAASIGLLGSLYDGEERSRILGYATSGMTTASIIIPLVGGWVGQTHWQAAFYLYGFGVVVAGGALVGLKDISSRPGVRLTTNQPGQLWGVLRQPSILRLYFLLMAAALIVYAVVIYTPLYLKAEINAGPELNGLVLAVRGMGAAIVSAVAAARVAKAIGPKQAIALGFLLMAVTLVTIPLLHQIEWILPIAVLFGAGFGIVSPNVYNTLANLSPTDLRTSVLAIGTGFNSLGQFISPLILGSIWKQAGLPVVFYVTATIALATAALSLMLERVEHK